MRSLIFAVLSALAPPLKAQRLHAKVDAIEAWRATLPEKKRIRRWRPSSARQRPMSAGWPHGDTHSSLQFVVRLGRIIFKMNVRQLKA